MITLPETSFDKEFAENHCGRWIHASWLFPHDGCQAMVYYNTIEDGKKVTKMLYAMLTIDYDNGMIHGEVVGTGSDCGSFDVKAEDLWFQPIWEPDFSRGRKFFREHRGGYAESMETMKQVKSLADIEAHYSSDPLTKGYYKNIRIDVESRRRHRTPQDDWGKDTFMVVADFDGYTGQCIGYTNFVEFKD